MKKKTARKKSEQQARPMRSDAQRKMNAVLDAAAEIFTRSGVDAPVREIAERAGVGLGTMYRHFPQRSDLIVAVFRKEVDACAQAAPALARKYDPGEALERWVQRYVDFIATKRGLATALHSGEPAYAALPGHFKANLLPAIERLLNDAAAAGAVRRGINGADLLTAIAVLCQGRHGSEPAYARRMVALLVDGMRYGAKR